MKAIKQVVIPEDKMKRYIEYCKCKTSTVICDCGNIVEVSLTPYFYDNKQNDMYFASICPKCGELIIIKE